MAITALSADTLAKSGITSVQDIGRIAPGVQVGFGGAYTSPSIRGVSTITNGPNIENNIAVYVDGFYEPAAQIVNSDLPNLAGIEILKGPQGTLYGRNATGGAILINTLDPTESYKGKAELTYARFNDVRASAFVSGPIADNIGFSVGAYYRHSDGYIKKADPNKIGGVLDDAVPLTQATVRTKLKARIGERLTATLGYNYSLTNDPRGSLFSTFAYQPAALPAPPARPVEIGSVAYNHKTSGAAEMHQGTLKLALDTGIGTLTSYTAYSGRDLVTAYDFDGTYVDQVSNVNPFTHNSFQQAFDFVIDKIDGVDLVLGGLYYTDEISNGTKGVQNYGANRVLTSRALAKTTTDAWAAYADATLQVSDAISFNVGGRYSREKKGVDFTQISYATVPAGSIVFGPIHREAVFSKFTPRASVRLEVAPRTNLYASYSKGFRSGAFALTPPATADLFRAARPEEVDAFEIGIKTAGSLLRFDVAAFYYDYKDLQVNVAARSPFCPAEPAPCGTIITLFDNAKKAESYGIDAQATLTPAEKLSIRAGFSWLHARYKDFTNATGTGVNASNTLNVSSQPQDWSGQQLARAPDFTGNLGFDYSVPVGNSELQFAANANYTTSYVISNPSLYGPLAPADLRGKQRFRQDGYALLNLSITWVDPSGNFHIGVFGRNLTNHKYRITYNGGAFGDYGALGEPVTYGVRTGFNF